ncbi:MAG: lyase family protein [Bacillota bacterium]|nr:lyase family protein [Bacillota bacterium]
MEDGVWSSLSPLDGRYRAANPALWEKLSAYLSEEAYLRYQLEVEVALVEGLAAAGVCPPEAAAEVRAAAREVTPAEVAAEEERTRHNIRALVNCLQRRVSEEARPWVHFTATSADIMDTANALRLRAATREAVQPALLRLELALIRLAEREALTVQIGRTHGQHAVPVTFGYACAVYVDRLGQRIQAVETAARNLRGKLAGAVGAYNAASLFLPDARRFEEEVLGRLGLEPAGAATQIVEPEFVADYLHALVSTFSVLANLADDFRHLQRSEIAEIGEYFDPEQVGSSTMPHKRNPWNLEHVKSLYKEFMPRIVTVYLDQISEHQRDLTNSASSRFTVEVVAGLVLAAERLSGIIERLGLHREHLERNFAQARGSLVAEPLYLCLAAAGHPDAHEAVRRLTLEADRTGRPLLLLLEEHAELAPYAARFTPQQKAVLERPEEYVGLAGRRTFELCNAWRAALGLEGK